MLRYFIFIEYGLLPDLRVGVLISASQIRPMILPKITDKRSKGNAAQGLCGSPFMHPAQYAAWRVR